MKKEGCRVVIQGFGNVGSMAADLMQKVGYKIIGLADIGGGLYNETASMCPRSLIGSIRRRNHCRIIPAAAQR